MTPRPFAVLLIAGLFTGPVYAPDDPVAGNSTAVIATDDSPVVYLRRLAKDWELWVTREDGGTKLAPSAYVHQAMIYVGGLKYPAATKVSLFRFFLEVLKSNRFPKFEFREETNTALRSHNFIGPGGFTFSVNEDGHCTHTKPDPAGGGKVIVESFPITSNHDCHSIKVLGEILE